MKQKNTDIINDLEIKHEKVDIYDRERKPTGKTKVRYQDSLEIGEYFIAVQALIINSKCEILISKRTEKKKKYPSLWECTQGVVVSGETSIQGILRELKEELGIVLEEKEAILLKTEMTENKFKDIYLFKKDIEIEELKFSKDEVTDAKWVDIDTFTEIIKAEEMVPKIDIDSTDFYTALKLLRNAGRI